MTGPTQVLPAGYTQSAEINLKKNIRLMIALNIAALGIFILFFYFLPVLSALVRPEIKAFSVKITLGTIISTFVLTVIILMIHECIHGAFFWFFTHSRPVFGFGVLYAYASAPTWFFPKRQYAITALGPLVIIGVAGLLFLLLAPGSWVFMIAFLVALNTGGAVGDLYIFIRLLKVSPKGFANDIGDAVTFFDLPAAVA